MWLSQVKRSEERGYDLCISFPKCPLGEGAETLIISNLGETPSWLISSALLFPNELFSEQKRMRMKCITLGLIHHTKVVIQFECTTLATASAFSHIDYV